MSNRHEECRNHLHTQRFSLYDQRYDVESKTAPPRLCGLLCGLLFFGRGLQSAGSNYAHNQSLKSHHDLRVQ